MVLASAFRIVASDGSKSFALENIMALIAWLTVGGIAGWIANILFP